MAKLIYSALCSVDGYVADANGGFQWAAPDEEVGAAVNDLLRPTGTQLYGRRMYDVIVVWETMDTGPDQHPIARDFAQMWRAADKIVYSTTLSAAQSARTRIERHFDADQIRAMKSSAERDLTIGGSTLTALAFRHGLVDECHLFLSPVVVGGGLPALPVSARTPLELVGDRRFTNGTMQLHYRVKEQSPE